ncbi:MAG: DUF2513 domain-containing protein [Hyphomonas sp.]
MKRDLDLIRQLLLKIESERRADVDGFIDPATVPGFSSSEIDSHVRLMEEAGLLTTKLAWRPILQASLPAGSPGRAMSSGPDPRG